MSMGNKRLVGPGSASATLREIARLAAAPVGPHLTDGEVASLAVGEASDAAERWQQHVAACGECARALAELNERMDPWRGPDGDARLDALADRIRGAKSTSDTVVDRLVAVVADLLPSVRSAFAALVQPASPGAVYAASAVPKASSDASPARSPASVFVSDGDLYVVIDVAAEFAGRAVAVSIGGVRATGQFLALDATNARAQIVFREGTWRGGGELSVDLP